LEQEKRRLEEEQRLEEERRKLEFLALSDREKVLFTKIDFTACVSFSAG